MKSFATTEETILKLHTLEKSHYFEGGCCTKESKARKEAISVFQFTMNQPGIATIDNEDNDQLEDGNLQMIRNQEEI